ncbi:MAG: EndoU domain-containing protein [Roseateles sp.]|uniref:EndoU domain-containing protein n=1 Tax=Roseateles sp. TaxID=1971397 RepID=UPI0039E9F924
MSLSLWPGPPGKTAFPESWNGDKIIHEIGDIATSPNTQWYIQKGSANGLTASGNPGVWVAFEVRDGVRIRVAYEPVTGRVITGFPDTNPIPPALKPVKKGKP